MIFVAAPPASHLPPPSTAVQAPAAAVSASDFMGQSDKYDAFKFDMTSSVASNSNAKLDATPVDVPSELPTAKHQAAAEEEFADFASFSAEPAASGATKTFPIVSEGAKANSTREADDFLFDSATPAPPQVTSHSQSSDKYSALKELISNKTLFSSAPVVPAEYAQESRDSDTKVLPAALLEGDEDFASFASFDNNQINTVTFHSDKPAADVVEQSTDDGWADFAAAPPATNSEVMPAVTSSILKPTERKIEKPGNLFRVLCKQI